MAKHYFENLNEIGVYEDYVQEFREEKYQREKDAKYYGTETDTSTYERDMGEIPVIKKVKIQRKPQQPVKQMKKPKKGKGIVKVIAGVGAVVLCAAGIIYAFNNIDKIREELKKNSDAIPPSSFSYGIPDNHDDDYSYDDEQDKGFTR